MKNLIVLFGIIALSAMNVFSQTTPEDPKPSDPYPSVPHFPTSHVTYELHYNDPIHSGHEFTFAITANNKPLKVKIKNISPKPEPDPNKPGFDPSKPTTEYTAEGYIEDRSSSKIVFSLKPDGEREITIDKLGFVSLTSMTLS